MAISDDLEPTLARYFFRIQNGNNSEHVEMDYNSPKAMREEAFRLAGESIKEIAREPHNGHWSLQVKNTSDSVVFSLKVEMSEPPK